MNILVKGRFGSLAYKAHFPYNGYMNYKIYKKEQFNTSNWSGGSTRELAIYPEDARYKKQNFIWRLSSALVDHEESRFTRLPDYNRILMVLEGEVILSHNEERVAKVGRLEQDQFDGGAMTKSFGKITDYNLMVRKGCEGFLDVVLPTNEKMDLIQEPADDYTYISIGLYCLSGYSAVVINNQSVMVREGQLLVVDYEQNETIQLGIMGEGETIRSQVFYNPMILEPEIIPQQKASFEDFKLSAQIALTNFHGSRYFFKWLRETWFDEALKKGIRKIERFYLPFVLWTVGMMGLSIGGIETWEPRVMITLLIVWTIVLIFILTPIMYFAVLPKPVKRHIKRMDALTEYEKGVLAKELAENSKADRILKKYKITGRNVHIEDKPKSKKK